MKVETIAQALDNWNRRLALWALGVRRMPVAITVAPGSGITANISSISSSECAKVSSAGRALGIEVCCTGL
ncbi:MAG: hypothetical protein DMG98_23330 [Acidobacteria bacterium]|nr:MAG: hypothetical protein DMG98_23330 [Acidobacteriota bacterium]